MQLRGPYTYRLTFTEDEITKVDNDERGKFRDPVTQRRRPKLYVISHSQRPIYVGTTTRPIRSRLNDGFNADPKTTNGYYGYPWKQLGQVTIDVWMLDLDIGTDPKHEAETLEAEVAFLIRQSGQWPKYQSEIHFHQSQDSHRVAAKTIVDHY